MGRSPSEIQRRSTKNEPPGARSNVPLRLTVAGGALGIESYADLPLEPLLVTELGWTLPNLRFPIDLSGGVDMFRHRRGELSRLCLRASFTSLARFVDRRLRQVAGKTSLPAHLWPLEFGVGIGLSGELGSLAFDLIWAPSAGAARWVVCNARGVGRLNVPLAQALRAAETLFAGLGVRRGRVITIEDVGRRTSQELVPALGARAPDASQAVLAEWAVDAEGFNLWLRPGVAPPALAPAQVRALELGKLTTDADDLLAQGNADGAREQYVTALARAPRHPELVALVAEIDAEHGDRAEAALGMLVDCMPAANFGLIGATLLSRVGDASGARQAVRNAVAAEVFAPLSAALWQRLADLSTDLAERRHALDQAVACAPALGAARWARFFLRVEAGDETGALGDAESLEASAPSTREKYEVLMRAAAALVDHRFVRSAGQLFERALRYVPADPGATFGLARALLAAGRDERALALLERAVELADAAETPHGDALIELARLLAERCGDHPQAIARVSRVPRDSPRYLEALALEGRWRAQLGDLRGASLAFARLREACDLASQQHVLPEACAWLAEAAEFERHSLGDWAATERHLAAALRLSPKSTRLRRLYREAAAAVAKKRS